MSTLRVNTLQNTSTTDGGISINASGHVTVDGVAMPSAGPLSNRNLIINGAMQVAQRGTSFTGLSHNAHSCDRWKHGAQVGAIDATQSTDAPSGFKYSMKLTQTTADTTQTNEWQGFSQIIEAQNVRHLAWGTSIAQPLTLSFWVKSSVAGTYSVALLTYGTVAGYTDTYTINSANTWEKKTVTIAAASTDYMSSASDNAGGIQIVWSLSDAPSYNTSADQTWETGTLFITPTSVVDWANNSNATFYITGVQLEVGSVATPFEHRSYGDELARCQRYYQRASASSGSVYARLLPLGHMATSTVLRVVVPLHPPMRTQPTFNQSGTFTTQPSVGTPGLSLETISSVGGESATLIDNTSISGTSGNSIAVNANNDSSAFVEFSAEL